MITFSKLDKMGRLGNSLFQIAAVIGHALRCGQSYKFPLWKYSKYFKHPIPQGSISVLNTYKENGFQYQEIPQAVNLNLEGYFQSWKYFNHCKELIFKYLEPSEEIKDWVQVHRPEGVLTALHVRRTDYIKMAHYYYNLGEEYYSEALSKIDNPGKTIIFSDDIAWCKVHMKADYYSEGNEIQDLFLMASCENKILANSSFSYWAAILGEGTVIAPKKWFKEIAKHDTKDLYLPSWVQI